MLGDTMDNSSLPLPGLSRNKVLLGISTALTAYVGVMWVLGLGSLLLSYSLLIKIEDSISFIELALVFWYTAYRIWHLPLTTPSERRQHLAHFLVALWVIFLATPLILVLLNLSPGGMDFLGWFVFVLETIGFAVAVYLLTTTTWLLWLIDRLYVVALVISPPLVGLLYTYWLALRLPLFLPDLLRYLLSWR